MRTSLHEDLSRAEEIRGPSDRSFGLTVGGILLAIVAWRFVFHDSGWFVWSLGAVALALIAAALVAPARLAPLNRAWLRLGLLLSKVVSPIVLGLIYATTIVPIGLIRRALGHDPLRLKFEPDADTYWLRREPGPAPDTMTNQF